MGTGAAKFYRQGCTEFRGKLEMAEEQRDQIIFYYYSWQLKKQKQKFGIINLSWCLRQAHPINVTILIKVYKIEKHSKHHTLFT